MRNGFFLCASPGAWAGARAAPARAARGGSRAEPERAAERLFDEAPGGLGGEGVDRDLLEEVVPGAALLVPLPPDVDSGDDGGEVLAEALHEEAPQALAHPRVVVVELVHLVDQQHQLDPLGGPRREPLEEIVELA